MSKRNVDMADQPLAALPRNCVADKLPMIGAGTRRFEHFIIFFKCARRLIEQLPDTSIDRLRKMLMSFFEGEGLGIFHTVIPKRKLLPHIMTREETDKSNHLLNSGFMLVYNASVFPVGSLK